MREARPAEVALRLLGRATMDLVEACFEANTALPRALQEMLSGEEIAAIRVWQEWAAEKRGRRPDEVTPLVAGDLPQPPD